MSHHIVRAGDDLVYDTPSEFVERSVGFTRAPAVDEAGGSVQMGFGICTLDAGGTIDTHVHSFEESFYLLEGEVVIDTNEGSFRLRTGDYGVVPVGGPHSWRNLSDVPARWADMQAPMPRQRFGNDTYFPAAITSSEPVLVDARDPRTLSFGHIADSNMDPSKQTQDMLAVSASMRTALLVYSGISVKMMVDTDLGAQLSTMFMVQYEPNGLAGAHDHPLEEAYLILEGDVEATFDGEPYRLVPGDIAWAGVGCVHSFTNVGTGIVRWLETQAPAPPARHSYRFSRDWIYLSEQLEG